MKGQTRNTETIKKVLTYLKPYAFFTALSLVFSAISAGLLLYIPILAGKMIDMAVDFGNVDMQGILRLAILAGVVAVVAALLQWITNVINNKIVFNIVRDIRREAYQRLATLPLSVLDSHQTGDFISRMVSDVDTMADGLLLGFTQFFQGVVTIGATLAFMFSINWIIALIVVVITPLSVFTAKYIASHTYSKFKEQSKNKGVTTSLVNECLENQKLIIAYSQGQNVIDKFDQANRELQKSSLSATFFSSLTNPATRFVNYLVYAAVAVAGAVICIKNPLLLTIGNLTSLLAYSKKYTKPFNDISDTFTEMQNALACAERVFALIALPQEEDPTDAVTLENAQGNVQIKNLYFSYVKDKPLLTDVNVEAKKGMKIAIVGPTGCGKTTLINLLMKFYSPDKGEICLDGVEYSRLKASEVRANYGMVLQDTWLKSGASVKENVAFGKENATDEQIKTALEKSGAWGFVSRLEYGLDTVIADGGGNLSQGQKQLLCIARVMLCNPPVLILDEATSSIDTKTEMQIQRSFATLTKGKTSFTVAHRLSTIKDADLILVMKDGNIIEQGTHDELIEREGFYAKLLRSMSS